MSENVESLPQGADAEIASSTSQPCIMLIFGASGDLTKRLLIPSLYNLICDDLLSANFAVLGAASSQISSEQFRENISGEEQGIRKFHTRPTFEEDKWEDLVHRFHYQSASFDNLEDFKKLREKVSELDAEYHAGGNILFYFATSPSFFGTICDNLAYAGFKEGPGWRRIIVEKPFGTDLESARALNKAVLAHWEENQIYRVDHYLGKETVQNLLTFRFANGMFEPLWNKNNIDNIQFNVSEEIDVGDRGGYYDKAGVLRDMMQNHMFQMLAYLCMEPPSSFEPDAIRNEKAKLLNSVRIYKEDEVPQYFVRGQYGPSLNEQGEVVKPGYRKAKNVDPESNTETFAAGKLYIDNWRWQGVPIYLRSGKALWKRGTEIVVQFKRAPEAIFKGTTVNALGANRLIFHIQPHQGIELVFQAKTPGPTMSLQNVDMRFSYGEAFKASRYTGYEVMIYACTRNDATLFSRGDLVEAAWKIAQPILDYWEKTPALEFPNYPRGSWGPQCANELLERDGRRWFEVVTSEVLERSPLFRDATPLLLSSFILALRPRAAAAGKVILAKGSTNKEVFLISRGEVEVLDNSGEVIRILKDGDIFGDLGALNAKLRISTIRAKNLCDLFVLRQSDFNRILNEHPKFAESMMQIAYDRYKITNSEA